MVAPDRDRPVPHVPGAVRAGEEMSVSASGMDPGRVNAHVPNVARMYDYYLGGKDNYQADRQAAEALYDVSPDTPKIAIDNRAFLRRAVRCLSVAGIGQFLDIGSGLPTAENTHEIAQQQNPAARVLYVDNDPVVITHAQALLAGGQNVDVLHADARDTSAIIDYLRVHQTGYLTRPVGVLLVAVLHFIGDDDDPHAIVRRLMAAVAPGSYLVISHATVDESSAEEFAQWRAAYARTTASLAPRSRAQVTAFFDGLQLLEPGIVNVTRWRPWIGTAPQQTRTGCYAGVGRKP